MVVKTYIEKIVKENGKISVLDVRRHNKWSSMVYNAAFGTGGLTGSNERWTLKGVG